LGTAISVGHLVYRASWETLTADIELILDGNNFKIRLVIFYDSKELKEWTKRIKEKKASKGL